MPISRRRFLRSTTGAAAVAAAPLAPAQAQDPETDRILRWLATLLDRDALAAYQTLDRIRSRGGTDLVSSLIFCARYSPVFQPLIDSVLIDLTGEAHSGWFEWMLWQEQNPQIASHPAFYFFKREVFLRLDPNWEEFLRPEYIAPDAMRIRFEEVTWGGVVKDGIPSLDNPALIPAAEAEYLLDDDLVFGVEINGDIRAYPLRIMGWHEMFNEVIGGVPVALAYCTLCGAGILFETQLDGVDQPFVFGSTGMLYRSNKLMFDRQTESMWNQFTGEPVSGPLAQTGIVLAQRPVVITDWASWRGAHPDSQVLSLDTGHLRDYGSGVVYQEYFASDELMFPALVDQTLHAQKDYVFGVRLAGGAKAWPLEAFDGGRVINDTVGFHNLVLVGDAETRTVRAYDRGDLEFDADLMADGATWAPTEAALVASDGRQAARVAGHIAYWFAWAGYLGATAELWAEP